MLATPGLPHLDGVIRALGPAGAGEASILLAVGALYVISLVALLLGLGTRAAAVLTWFVHLALVTTGRGTNYGADRLANVFLFYLVWSPSGAALSLDRLLARARSGPSPMARLALRVVQVHLCIIYATSGVSKAMSRDWWDGDAIWRSVMSPEYRRFGFDFSWLAHHPWLAIVAGWAVLAVEIGYAVAVWLRSTRRPWILATVALHLGIAIFMGMVVFGAIMIVLTVAAFGVSAELRGFQAAGSPDGPALAADTAPREPHQRVARGLLGAEILDVDPPAQRRGRVPRDDADRLQRDQVPEELRHRLARRVPATRSAPSAG